MSGRVASIIELAAEIAIVDRLRGEFDNWLVSLDPAATMKASLQEAHDALQDAVFAMQDMVLRQPARTLDDLAFQSAVACLKVESIAESDLQKQAYSGVLEAELGDVRRALASIVRIAVQASGVSLDCFGATDTRDIDALIARATGAEGVP